MTAAQWQEVLCRVRSLSAADKDRLLTYLHALHDAAQQPKRAESMRRTRPRYCKAPSGLSKPYLYPVSRGNFRHFN